jgi:GNAT superfamily N-acetyltransferase
MEWSVTPASAADTVALARLHADSWRDAYRGILPDAFLAGPVEEDRLQLWQARMAERSDDKCLVLKAVHGAEIIGLSCVIVDAEPGWGPCLDNLHVEPGLKGHGVGGQLFSASRAWADAITPWQPMFLWVFARNLPARGFYERRGATVAGSREVAVAPGRVVSELRYVFYSSKMEA